MTNLTRRSFNRYLLASAAGAAAFGGLTVPAFADSRLRFMWWGNPTRDERTNAVVDLFEGNNSGIVVDTEALASNDYWPKIATQAAGGNMPDVMQMDYRFLFEYARRGQIVPLDDYVGNQIDLSNFDPGFVDSGRVDGQLFGIPFGANSPSVIYNMAKFAEYGVTLPDHSWTWDEFWDFARQIKAVAPEGQWAVADKAAWEPAFDIFLRQQGKQLYTEQGELGYTAADAAEYFEMWRQAREEGLVPPADITAQDSDGLDTRPISRRRVAIDFAHSNHLGGLQGQNPDELGITLFPHREGGVPGQYMKCATLLCITANSDAKDDAAKLVNYLLTDPEANKILRMERGVPGDNAIAATLLEDPDDIERKTIEYFAIVQDNVSPMPPPPPAGAGEVEVMMVRLYGELIFDRLTPEEAGERLVNDAQAILDRA
ncbi:ABC transporter substrate-binding protein [Devosia sediminis]|uniref:Extracellular solute-binding protein n=1 Tax=Devosia sediminis TaxID=2798801 RepID=A0A934MM50_9HYPH|nr:extracellular solute-binding protein [Devosia sediminis]MBJ3785835.1 extracellular solute-binding protein [Devosia sediminis]